MQQELQTWENPVNFENIRPHSNLPGPLSEGNAKAVSPLTLFLFPRNSQPKTKKHKILMHVFIKMLQH